MLGTGFAAVVAAAIGSPAAAAGAAAAANARAPAPEAHRPAAQADSAQVLPPAYPPPDSALAAALQKGGFVIVFRHAITDAAQRDVNIESFDDRSAQRNLSARGRTQSEEIGRAIDSLGVPVGDVLASPMWRCRDTAQLAFGRHETSINLFQKGAPQREARVLLLSTIPKEGTNTVLVTHQDVLLPIVPSLKRDQLREGEALVVKPLGDRKFEVLAQAGPEHWKGLAARFKP